MVTAPGNSTAVASPAEHPDGYIYGEVVSLTSHCRLWLALRPLERRRNRDRSSDAVAVHPICLRDGDLCAGALRDPGWQAQSIGGGTAGATTLQHQQPADPASYIYGEDVTLMAMPTQGWRFVEWQEGQDRQRHSP